MSEKPVEDTPISTYTDPDSSKLKVFKTLGMVFSVIFKNKSFYFRFLLFSLVTLTGFSIILYSVMFFIMNTAIYSAFNTFWKFGFIAIYIFALLIVQTTTTYGTIELLQRSTVTLWRSFIYSLKSLLSVIGVISVFFLIGMVVLLLLSVLLSVPDFLAIIGIPVIVSGLTVFIFICFAFFRILMLISMFYIALPICVYEKLGPLDTFRRAYYLVSGSNYRGKVIGISFMTGLIYNVFNKSFELLLDQIGFISGAFSTMFCVFAIEIIISVFSMVVPVVTYFRLRQIKDGGFLNNQN